MKYDFDLEDHSKKRKEIFLRVLLCALEIGVVLFVAYAITHFGLEKNDGIREIYESYLERWG